MKKTVIAVSLVLIFTLCLSVAGIQPVKAASGGKWVLTGINNPGESGDIDAPLLLDIEGAGSFRKGSVDLAKETMSFHYHRVTNDVVRDDYVVRVSFKAPPEEIIPGQTISLEVSGEIVSGSLDTNKGTSFTYSASIDTKEASETLGRVNVWIRESDPNPSGTLTFEVPEAEGWLSIHIASSVSNVHVTWNYEPGEGVVSTGEDKSGGEAGKTEGDTGSGEKSSRGIQQTETIAVTSRTREEAGETIRAADKLIRERNTAFVGGEAEVLSDNPEAFVEGSIADDIGGEKARIGITLDDVIDQVSENVKAPSGVNIDSTEEIFEKVKNMVWAENPETGEFTRTRSSGHDSVDVKFNDGKSVKVGILVTPEGRTMYTANGKDYYPKLETAIDPSYFEKTKRFVSGMKDKIWDTLFVGSTRNKDIDLQNAVASEVMEDLREQLSAGEKPKSLGDWTEGKLWDNVVKDPLKKNMHKLLWEKAKEALDKKIVSGDLISDKSKEALVDIFEKAKFQFNNGETTTPKAWTNFRSETGIDLFDLTKAGEVAVAGGEFAVESVKTMGRGLQDADFAVRSRVYITERQAGHSPEVIWQRVRGGDLGAELEIGSAKFVSGGVSSFMASSKIAQEAQLGIMFTMYEQAYQRYLVAKEIGR